MSWLAEDQTARWDTRKDLYLQARSEHHPSQKSSVLKIPIQRAKIIHDKHSLDVEMSHLKGTFRRNGYSNLVIMRALVQKRRPQAEKEKPAGVAMLSCQQAVSNKISRLLSKHNIKTIHMVRTLNDKLGLKVAGVHCVPCEWGKMYVGHTTESMIPRAKSI
jgi:hypothetical protein